MGILISMPFMSSFLGVTRAFFFRRAVGLVVGLVFRFARGFALGLLIFMPGMFCMSCCARAARLAAETSASDTRMRVAACKMVRPVFVRLI
jgi:hypothetical protein